MVKPSSPAGACFLSLLNSSQKLMNGREVNPIQLPWITETQSYSKHNYQCQLMQMRAWPNSSRLLSWLAAVSKSKESLQPGRCHLQTRESGKTAARFRPILVCSWAPDQKKRCGSSARAVETSCSRPAQVGVLMTPTDGKDCMTSRWHVVASCVNPSELAGGRELR